jgi:hypothetical protein
MSKFIIPVKDQFGNNVYFETSAHKGQVSVDGYANVLMWLEKNGFTIVLSDVPKPVTPAPQPATPPQGGHFCPECGLPQVYKEGVGKSGKPYKGYFCTGSEKGHTVTWLK